MSRRRHEQVSVGAGSKIFDFAEWAEPLTEAIKANSEAVAAGGGITIDYIRRKNFRKEDKIQTLLKERGNRPGPV